MFPLQGYPLPKPQALGVQATNNILTYAGRWNKDRTYDLLERVQAVTNSAYTKTDGGVSLHSTVLVYTGKWEGGAVVNGRVTINLTGANFELQPTYMP